MHRKMDFYCLTFKGRCHGLLAPPPGIRHWSGTWVPFSALMLLVG